MFKCLAVNAKLSWPWPHGTYSFGLASNEYLSKRNQDLVHYLSCHGLSDVMCILISALAVCLKALAV